MTWPSWPILSVSSRLRPDIAWGPSISGPHAWRWCSFEQWRRKLFPRALGASILCCPTWVATLQGLSQLSRRSPEDVCSIGLSSRRPILGLLFASFGAPSQLLDGGLHHRHLTHFVSSAELKPPCRRPSSNLEIHLNLHNHLQHHNCRIIPC